MKQRTDRLNNHLNPKPGFWLTLLLCCCFFVGPSAHAATDACPSGNLLAGRKPVQKVDWKGNLGAPTDGKVAKEGAQWNANELTVVLDSAVAALTWDLGREYPLAALYVQSDANDTLRVWGAGSDGIFEELPSITPMPAGVHGLRSRPLTLGGRRVRFIKIGEGTGDNLFSLSEVQAYCELPSPFPPQLQTVEAPKQKGKKRRFWNNESSKVWETIWALLVFALLTWRWRVRRRNASRVREKIRDILLAVTLLISSLTYVNFFSFHFPNFHHAWDTFHYYAGAKYFKELGYSRLYECIAVADYQVPHLKRRVELRKITNLRTNALETTEDILAHPERCTKHFSPARWRSWTQDIAYFRAKESPKRWDDTSTDHGYNATPVWNIAGSLLANSAPASDSQIFLLNLIDPAYYVAMIAIIWWAFGWRVAAVGLAVFATYFPSRYYWTGGAFLRWDWIFYTVGAICLLRKERPLLAGVFLGYATLLRVFPGFVFVGPLIAWVTHLWQSRSLWPLSDISKRYVRLFSGAALAVALLVPISLATSHGVQTYEEFVANSVKHKETPLTNYMGWRTVVAYRPSEVGRLMKNRNVTDPWAKWKQARLDAYKAAKPIYLAGILGFLILIYLAVRKRTEHAWMAAAFGVALIPMTVELTCYYYAFIIGLALLSEKQESVGRLLLLLCAASQFISLHPLPGMSGWIDEQYTLISALTVGCFALVVAWFGPLQERDPLGMEPLPQDSGDKTKSPASAGRRATTPSPAKRRARR